MAAIINNPALPPSPGIPSNPYGDLTSNPNTITPTGGGDPVAQANLWLDAMVNNPYEGYAIRTFMFWDEGVTSQPVAGAPGTKAEIVRLSAGSGSRAVAWYAQRLGAKPQAPQPEANTDIQVFKGEQLVLDSAVLQPDGVTWLYTLAGYYEYLLTRRVSPAQGDSVSFGQPPYASGDATAAANAFAPADLTSGITVAPV